MCDDYYMDTTTAAARKASLFAQTATAVLVQSALRLDAQTEYAEGERITLAWISDELTERMGGIQDDDAFDALLDLDITYTEALLVTFPKLAA